MVRSKLVTELPRPAPSRARPAPENGMQEEQNSMYTIAVLALMSLALFKLTDLIEEHLPGLTRFHVLMTVVLGIAGAVWLDYSFTEGFKVAFRNEWMGTWLTGLAVAGATSVWRALFH